MEEGELNTWPNHELSNFVEAGGIRWHVQQSGSGPPLLLVHGTAASTHSWRDVLPILARRYSVLALDLPGHAFTGAVPAAQSSIVAHANLVSALLEKMQFAPAFVAGHSAGAVVLCQMSLGRRINPRVIVSVNGAFLPLAGRAGAWFAPLAKLLAANSFLPRLVAWRAGNRKSVARLLESTGSHLDSRGVDLYARLVQQPAHVAGALRMMSQWDLDAFAARLPLLEPPLALLVASQDKAVPAQQALEVMQIVANCTLHPFPGLGHLAHEEQPALIAERILQICATYETR